MSLFGSAERQHEMSATESQANELRCSHPTVSRSLSLYNSQDAVVNQVTV